MPQLIHVIIGTEYNQTAILTNNRFDPVKYEAIGPAWFSATNALSLITNNLAMGATTVHVFLFYWKELQPFLVSMNPFNKTTVITHDEHYEKMKVYKKIPKSWFLVLLVAAYAVAQATNYTGHSDFNWWMLTVVRRAIVSTGFAYIWAYQMFACLYRL